MSEDNSSGNISREDAKARSRVNLILMNPFIEIRLINDGSTPSPKLSPSRLRVNPDQTRA
jgi:hypothetical protein